MQVQAHAENRAENYAVHGHFQWCHLLTAYKHHEEEETELERMFADGRWIDNATKM